MPICRSRGFLGVWSRRWGRLMELAKNRVNPPLVNGKSIQSEHRRAIKRIFAEFNQIYDQIVPAEFYVDVSSSAIKAEIMKAANDMLAEYRVMWEKYTALPFSLHHRKQYLLHPPNEVDDEIHALFSRHECSVC